MCIFYRNTLKFFSISVTAPSTSGPPPSYSTEEIIGTSTSTSIEIRPALSTEQTFASSNVYLQNTTMPSGAATESSIFEYNSTSTSSSSMFASNISELFTSTTPVMPHLEGVDYRQSKFCPFPSSIKTLYNTRIH